MLIHEINCKSSNKESKSLEIISRYLELLFFFKNEVLYFWYDYEILETI